MASSHFADVLIDTHFADVLIERTRALGHPLCVGLDPHLPLIPALFRRGTMAASDPQTSEVVEAFCIAILERVAGQVAAVKPQVALFEQLGVHGFAALSRVVTRARDLGLLVIMDAKRGDIGSTAEGYAASYLYPNAPFASAALTVNAYMGLDTLEPYLQAVKEHGCGVFVLVKTSNAGSAALQDVSTQGVPLFVHLAQLLQPLCDAHCGPVSGWSSVGCVVGATYPEQAQRLRQTLPRSLFLIPGYGSQGASAREAVSSFVKGPVGLEGGLVNSSRAILFPKGSSTASSLPQWKQAIDEAVSQAVDELGQAVSRVS